MQGEIEPSRGQEVTVQFNCADIPFIETILWLRRGVLWHWYQEQMEKQFDAKSPKRVPGR
jgi:hypothetical protein